MKQDHLRAKHPAEAGTIWTWTAIDRASRLAVAFHVGKRTEENARAFLCDLRVRLAAVPQFTSDGLAVYATAIAHAFGAEVDYATTVKKWNTSKRPARETTKGTAELLVKSPVFGEPDMGRATTAHNERVNLTMRHMNGRMRRKVLAFSKTLAGHKAAAALSYVSYNLCRVVRTIKTTPAVRAGIADHVWGLPEFMEAVLSAPLCALPAPMPLRPRERPPETPSERKAREALNATKRLARERPKTEDGQRSLYDLLASMPPDSTTAPSVPR